MSPLLRSVPQVQLHTVVLPELEPTILWQAKHSQMAPVEGGWQGARVLIGACNGDEWPWTTLERPGFGFAQVMGDYDSLIVEISTDAYVARVIRSHPVADIHAEYLNGADDAELFTVEEAWQICRAHLLGQPLAPGLSTRPVR